MSLVTRRSCPAWVPAVVLLLTVGQLAVAEWWPGIERFADKAFGARLVAYPVLMLLAPAIWWLVVRRHDRTALPPYGACTLIMLPFLIDVTGNSLDLYDSVVWWDDFNHWINWLLLLTGIGLLIGRQVRPAWVLVVLITGLGAILAIGWELGEWWTFIRHGTELDTAYEDTLGDLTLGTLGAMCAGFVVLWARRRRAPVA
jgi:hypothetical protein